LRANIKFRKTLRRDPLSAVDDALMMGIDHEKFGEYEEHVKSAIEEIRRRTLGSDLLEEDDEESLDQLSEGQIDQAIGDPQPPAKGVSSKVQSKLTSSNARGWQETASNNRKKPTN